MLRFTLILSAIAVLASGCSKKTAAELQEEQRQKLREDKRSAAIKQYKELADKYPDHEKARQAADKAKALEQAPKK